MYEYEIRNGVKATDILQNYGFDRQLSSYLKDEFGMPGYRKIIQASLNTGKPGKKKMSRKVKNGGKMGMSFHRGITSKQ